MRERISAWHVGVAAEAYAAGMFARCGINVLVQYGANQPEYDLVVASGDLMLKVSVKGSQDGRWGLTQNFLKDADYAAAANQWLEQHKAKTVLCLVQFKGVPLDSHPRMYLATPKEIAARLRATAAGRGDTILFESHKWARNAHAAGLEERVPDDWRFTADRAHDLLRTLG